MRNPFISIAFAALSHIFGLGSRSMDLASKAVEDMPGGVPLYNMGGRQYGLDHSSSGARAHRRWKQRRASGLTTRKRR